MKRSFISDVVPEKDGVHVRLAGWIADVRDLAKVKFVLIRDKTGLLQTIAKKGVTPDALFESISKIPRESVVEVEGVVSANKEAKKGVEVVIDGLTVVNPSVTPLPVDTSVKSQTHEHKRIDFRFLDTRRPDINAIFRVRSFMEYAIADFFKKRCFVQITTPKITAAGLESGAEMFEVKYFDRQAFLSQSPQLYKQMFVCGGFERVFEIGPVFRAEKSHTTRHVTEFTGVDFEVGFIEDENDPMDVVEDMIRSMIKDVEANCAEELGLFDVDVLLPDKIPRLDMSEVSSFLKEKGKVVVDLDAEAERLLCDIVRDKFKSDFVFVVNYPWSVRPFYHMRKGDGGTRSFDLLWNGVEVATGAQREHRYDVLKSQAAEKGINLDEMGFYADIFRFGAPPHGGAGMGLDRFVQCLLKLDNIREAILLPRDPERLTP